MAFCPKGHHYDENTHHACPWCAQGSQPSGGGAAPATQYEEGAAQGGYRPAYQGGALPPIQPMPRDFLSGSAARGPTPVAPLAGGSPLGTPQKTTYMEATEAAERLMGFLVITQTRHDEEHRYFRLRKGVNFVGRIGSRCSVEIRDEEISNQHVLLVCTNNATRAIDLDSRNGMTIGGDKFEIAELAEGDELRVGRTTLKFVPFPWVAED